MFRWQYAEWVTAVVLLALVGQSVGQIVVTWGNDNPGTTNAANLAVEDVFKATGWRAQLIELPDVVSTDRPSVVVSKMCATIATESVLGVLGPATSEQLAVAGLVSSANALPILSHSATGSDFPDTLGYTAVSRSISLDSNQAEALISFILQLGFTSCGILYSQDSYGVGILRLISEANPFAFTAIPIETDATTFTSEIRTLLYQHQQVLILVVAGVKQTGLVLNEAKDTGLLLKAGWVVSEAATGNFESSGATGVDNILGLRPIVDSIPGVDDSLYSKTAYLGTKAMLETLFELGLHSDPADRYTDADCFVGSQTWTHGKSVSDALREKTKIFQNSMWELVNYHSGNWTRVGNWTAEETNVNGDDIVWSTHQPPNPSSLLTGDHLRVLFPCDVPGLSAATDSGVGVGILWDIVKNISTEYHFTWDPYISCYECNHTNCVDGNNLDQLSNGEFDLFAVALTVTPSRQDFMDFTFPWTTDAKRLLVLRPTEESTNLWRFLEPMEYTVYVSIAICVIVFGIALWIIEANRNPEVAVQNGLVSTLWLAFTHTFLINQDNPYTESGRVLAAGYLILATVFISAYTAELTSFLTNAENSLYEADELEQFLTGEIPIHLLGVELDSAVDGILTDAIQVSGYRLIRNQSEAHDLLRDGVIHAFIESQLYFDFHRECDFELRGPEIAQLQEFKAFALPKNSPLTSAFNRAIVYLSHVRGSDTIRADHVAMTTGIHCSDEEVSDEETGMSLEAMYGPLIVTGVIFAAAFVLRWIRFVRNFFHKRRLMKTKVRWSSRLSLLPSKLIMELALSMMPMFTASQARTRKELVYQIVSRLILLVTPKGYETHNGAQSLLIVSTLLNIPLTVETTAQEMAELIRTKLDEKLNAEERLRAQQDGGGSYLSSDVSVSSSDTDSGYSDSEFDPFDRSTKSSTTANSVHRSKTQPLSVSDKNRRPAVSSTAVEAAAEGTSNGKKLAFTFDPQQKQQQKQRSERRTSFKNPHDEGEDLERKKTQPIGSPCSMASSSSGEDEFVRHTTQPQQKRPIEDDDDAASESEDIGIQVEEAESIISTTEAETHDDEQKE
eukprot:TRINITY_DN21716_c0_g1_i1.p1 TRINITY_DN21716_c0_g1~~TRINITY_DN21716_c0_g1_i1.p1  ORF type:complete len:1073 (+),score=210.60 TRINITY_DN21716_c0_g1_i1:30-3248(+)